MTESNILLFLSVLPVFLLGYFIYNKDRNKEPLGIIAKLFVGGVLSCIVTLLVSALLYTLVPFFGTETNKLNLLELFIQVFVGVAMIEETSKWLFLYLFSYHDDEFDELYDMIVYGAFVALGFACIENIMYVLDGGITTGILRALCAVPGHAFDGVFMGYYLGLAKISEMNNREDLKRKNILFSLLVPMILHAIYDYCALSGRTILIIIFFIFVIILYVIAIKKINKTAKITRKIKYKNTFCPVCGRKAESEYCPICGHKND
ncbi:MAG: PrsW family intramembrane metalloprotease [Bacilli bacterium]|nr:PrsW family intramembrane metalloprotease [Bacilli bacterium]